jgi:two-component system response regulator YesN
MIVDDDDIMRLGIEKNIDWQSHGIRVVASVSNGKECVDKLKEYMPDVILSDIMMSSMDGLQLAESIQKFYPQIKVVLLTAYDEFQYVKRALDLKVTEYVMKSETNGKILQAVEKACDECDSQKSNAEIICRSRDLLYNKFYYDLIVHYQDDRSVESDAAKLKIHFRGSLFCMAAFGIERRAGTREPARFCERETALEALKNAWKTDPQLMKVSAHCFIYNNLFNVLFDFDPSDITACESLLHLIPIISKKLSAKLDAGVVAGVGKLYHGFGRISRSYSEALQCLKMRNVLSEGGGQDVIFMDSLQGENISKKTLVQQILQYIEENYCREELSLNLIAREVHVSSTYISSVFKKCKGVNVNEYITGLRLKKAMELLRSTSLKACEISTRVGYSNSQYFSVVFKKNIGLSPTEYRQSGLAAG